MNTLRLNVYRWTLGDCSNGGVTGRYDDIFVVCEDGNKTDIDETDERLFKIVVKRTFESVYAYLGPVNKPTGLVGPMMGGAYAGTSDSRFCRMVERATGVRMGILPVHDRFETQQQYDALSR